MHQSIATIESPEFINLQPLDINPLMSSCEIKVLYVGENRNRSFISKEVATEMAKTLRGAPIVGYFRQDKQDFADHGDRMIIDDEGIKFECMTRPYGFVAPDAKVWFQKFEDVDDFGESVTREYLMTTGFLWTGQFEECKSAVEGEGKPHSMELDKDTLDGKWAENYKKGMDFFIVNDAIFSKLCILGEDVEPCFEGSSVKAPQVSASFSKVDDDFKQTLFTMMQDLKNALEGGQNKMVKNFSKEQDNFDENSTVKNEYTVEESNSTEVSSDFKKDEEKEEKKDEAPAKEENTKDSEAPAKEEEDEKKKEKFAKADDEEKEEKKDEAPAKEDESKDAPAEDKKEENDKKKKFELLESEYAALQEKFAALEQKCAELTEFKASIDNEKKDALIAQFYMLSDEDKAEVIENKAKYSLDDIESKLSVICFRKQISFDNTTSDAQEDEQPAVTFNLETESSVPAFITALKNTRNNRNI